MFSSIPSQSYDNLTYFLSENTSSTLNYTAWSKPRGIKMIWIMAVGCGGNGGSGFSGSSGTTRGGGGGGSQGGIVTLLLNAAETPDTLYFSIPGPGQQSYCSMNPLNTEFVFYNIPPASNGGNGGSGVSGASAGATTPGYNAYLGSTTFYVLQASSGSLTGGVPAATNITINRMISAATGGGGTSLGATAAGGSVNAATDALDSSLFPARTQSTTAGADGLDAMLLQNFNSTLLIVPATGGTSSNTGTGGKGGNGIYGSGGGGGGAGVTGGAGGTGGAGFVIIKCW